MSTKPPSAKRRALDWEAIERDYRTGRFTLRELEAKHGTNNATIARKIKTDRVTDPSRWQRDLAAVVRQATNAKLMQEMVSNEVSKGQQEVSNAVLAAAEMGKDVILRHRADVLAARNEAMSLLAELAWQRQHLPDLERMAEIVETISTPADAAGLRQMFNRTVGLSGRVSNIKALADVLVKLQPAERKAFNLDAEEGNEDNAYEERLRRLEAGEP